MISRYALFFGICLALPASAQAQMSDVICDDSLRMVKTLKEKQGAKRQVSIAE